MSWTCSRNHALGYSTTTQPYVHPNLKAPLSNFTGTIEAQEATTHCYGQPHHLRGNDSNSAAQEYTIYGVHSCFMHKKGSVKLIYLPAKILTGNNVKCVGCCTYYFLSDKYLTYLNWKLNCFYNSCTTKMLLWCLFILHISRQRSQISRCVHLLSLTDNSRLNGQLENSFYTNALAAISSLTGTWK